MEKRAIVGLVFGIILISLFVGVYAQDEDNQGPNLSVDIGKGVEDIKGIKSKTEETLEQDIKVPEELQIPARVIFGIKGEIPLQHFIVLIAVWIMLFLIIMSILKVIPLFGEGGKSWALAVVITCLIAITGAIRSIAIFFFNIGNIFGFLEKWSVLKIVLALIVSAAIFYGASILIKIINKKLMLDRAESAGAKAGAGAKMLEETFKQATES